LSERKLAGIFYRCDEMTADLVLKFLPLVPSPLFEERTETGAEDVAETFAWGDRQSVQQGLRGSVRRQDASVGVRSEQSRAQSMQIFPAIVEGDDDARAVLFAKQPIFDLGGRHADQGSGMRLPGQAVRRRVENATELAVGREHGNRRTGEIVVAREEMLGAVHREGAFEMRDAAESVGAANRLLPDGAGPDARGVRHGFETVVRHDIEQQSLWGGEGDHEIGPRDLLVQGVHFRQGQSANEGMSLVLLPQLRHGNDFRLGGMSRIEPVGDTAHPTVIDVRSEEIRRRHALALERGPGTFYGSSDGQHRHPPKTPNASVSSAV